MQFLILRGHTRLVPQGGLAEFPDAILNAKRLDLFNLYREVCFNLLTMVNAYHKSILRYWVPSGGFKGRLSCWKWHQLERTSFLEDAQSYID